MSYDEQLGKLQGIITSDDSTDEQRRVAREARDRLIDDANRKAMVRYEKRTDEYLSLTSQLDGILEQIRVNQLTTVIQDLDGFFAGLQEDGTSSNTPL